MMCKKLLMLKLDRTQPDTKETLEVLVDGEATKGVFTDIFDEVPKEVLKLIEEKKIY